MPSPVSFDHGRRDLIVHSWIGHYIGRSGVVEGAVNATWLMCDSAPQPDLALRLRREYGGQSREQEWRKEKYAAGAPELVVEVSRSSRSYDLGPKLALYERAGVKEYLAALLEERRLEWRVLREGRFELIPPDSDGIYRSAVFPGLWLDETAFWNEDIPRVLAVLEEGLASPEFAAFRQRFHAEKPAYSADPACFGS